MSLNEVKASASTRGRGWTAVCFRLALIVLVAVTVGWGLNRSAEGLGDDSRPAGFGRGFLQGALMPMALPNFLMGRDVRIYSENNNGVTYKLGYTSGVNACGAAFFSFLFWRLNRLRRSVGKPSAITDRLTD